MNRLAPLVALVSLALITTGAKAPRAAKPKLLVFSSRTCPPCQQLAPVVKRLQRERHHIQVIDVDRHPKQAQRYGVTTVPTIIRQVKHTETERIVGLTTEPELRRLLTPDPPPKETQ